MNYTTLFKTIQGYLENDFPSFTGADTVDGGAGTLTLTPQQQINTFITQAEKRIYNSVQFPQFRRNQTGTLTTSNSYLSLPSDFLAVYELAVIDPSTNGYEYLLNKDVSYIRASYPLPTTSGIPKYYALFDENTMLVGPTPAANYTVELHYFYYPESITVSATGTTWLCNNFDMTVLYGALVEGYTYMKGEPDMITNYNKRYEEAMILAKRLGDGMDRRDAYRSGQIRMSVN
ncbi:MAG: hypothetical protein EBR82_48930 [Caulobacteraceae bacterium]|nr:hypothetical protein [Caulobacteraceae bacterium]